MVDRQYGLPHQPFPPCAFYVAGNERTQSFAQDAATEDFYDAIYSDSVYVIIAIISSIFNRTSMPPT